MKLNSSSRPNLALRLAATLALLFAATAGRSQDIEPRRWSHMPIGANFAGVAYAYTIGDILFDPALRIENADFDLQTIGGKYIRSFALFGKSARFDLTQPYQMGTWRGLLDGVPTTAERDGWADTSVRFAVNLLGAPPLAGKEFAAYRAETECETILGAGLIVQLPTGEYFEDKLINLGGNRFVFRPQLGLVHNRGKWSAELTTAVWLFTANDDFFNGSELEQDPVFGADAHLIYTFRPGLWLAASFGYAGGGETIVNGAASNNRQNSPGWGIGLGLPITRAIGVKLGYSGNRTQTETGLDSDTFAAAVSVAW